MSIPDTLQDDTPPTDADRDAADKAAEAAFGLAFGSDEQEALQAGSNAPAEPPAAAPAPAASASAPAPAAPAPAPTAGAPAPSADEHDDPFAGLHPKVRDMLGNHQKLAAQAGRVPGLTSQLTKLQREVEELRKDRAAAPAPAATPSAPAPSPIRELSDRIRGELPEVADVTDAIEAALNRQIAAPAPKAPAAAPPAADAGDDDPVATAQADALRRVHPEWDKTFMSTDFNLWLSTQPEAFQTEVQTTNMAVIVSDALTKFGAHQQAGVVAAQRAEEAARQKNRLSSGRQVPGTRTPPRATGTYTSEEEAFEAGFKGT